MANIKDLAEMAGVSVTTVSRVLNNHPYVSDEKRKAVEEAVRALNYQKNINAVHLSRGKTMLIGVVLPFTDHSYFSLILKGIANQAMRENYKIVLFQTGYKKEREIEALQLLKQKQIDALIICSRASDLSMIERHTQYGPIILCEDVQSKSLSTTYISHYKVFQYALEYLYEKGHRRIGYCIGRRSGTSSSVRQHAYKDFHEKYHLPYNPAYIIDQCLYVEDGERVIDQIQRIEKTPTAMLVTSDQVAAGMIISSQRNELSIPGDLAIIGFNNEAIAGIMDITTIEIPLTEMGKNLFRQALGEKVSHHEFKEKLIERGTV
ncbi:LacI family DNA-binding transcriptional regulator [Oceanobacillus sp. HCA-5259]|uniref:LacI family DNA-binding transcriptional regulator n=1 Tax=Oceanobacillus sp. HCA-5259 TaxID=3134661 RepID=UPI0030C6583A